MNRCKKIWNWIASFCKVHSSKKVLLKALCWLLKILPNSDTFEFQCLLIADPLYINFISQKLYITSHQTQIFCTLFLFVSLLYSVLHYNISFSPSQIRVNTWCTSLPTFSPLNSTLFYSKLGACSNELRFLPIFLLHTYYNCINKEYYEFKAGNLICV